MASRDFRARPWVKAAIYREDPMPAAVGLALRVALVAATALAATVPAAVADHVTYNGASVDAREIAPEASGLPRVEYSWEIRCTNAQYYGGVVALYSYAAGRVIAAPGPIYGSASKGGLVSNQTLGPGRYKPQLIGPVCGALVDDGASHVGRGPEMVDGPDFEICSGAVAGDAGTSASWPVIPVGDASPCASDCDTRAATAAAWPVIPVPRGCEPDCRSGSASRAWPVIPARERCAPERLTDRNEAPVPVECPGGAGASRAWPVLPARGPCSGQVKLTTAKRVPCASSAIGWPVVRCSASRRKRIRLGSARFRLRAGRAGVVPVKVRRGARRLVKRQKRTAVRAKITLRKGDRRARTVRTFTLRAR